MKLKKLTLKREVLTQLTDTEAAKIAGGATAFCTVVCTEPSIDTPCHSDYNCDPYTRGGPGGSAGVECFSQVC